MLVVLSACAPEMAAPLLQQRSEITNGTFDDGDSSVVAIRVAGSLLCTGVLIAPSVVLSAAHCRFERQSLLDYDVVVGSDVASGMAVRVTDVTVHPGYDVKYNDHDLVLLHLEHPVQVDIVPMSTTPTGGTFVDQPVRVVGFGVRTVGSKPDGRKYQGAAIFRGWTDTELTYGPNPSQACQHDSGGPAFMTLGGTEYLVGITSRGDGQCQSYTTDVRVDAYLESFIKPYLARTAAGTAAMGAPCVSDAQCAEGRCVAASDDLRLRFCLPGCSTPTLCPEGLVCGPAGSDLRCHHPLPSPSALGFSCTQAADCIDGECLTAPGTEQTYCSHTCNAAIGDCPDGFECTYVPGRVHFCFPAPAPTVRSGCAAAPNDAAAWLLISLAAVLRRSRKR